MTSPDMDVIKEIPGYKVILKAILKSQIQQLVEQLADHTEEESIILTASVSDGTLSHLGSDSGKSFLEDHEDVKSQFLGFCLKFHHKRKQEKERKEQEEKELQLIQQQQQAQQAQQAQQRAQFSPRGPSYPPRMAFSPRFPSPRQQMMRSPGARHEPYPVSRPIRRTSLNFGARGRGGAGAMRLPHKVDNQVIKIEAEDPDESSNQSGGGDSTPRPESGGEAASGSSQPSSPTHLTPAQVKSESSGEREDDTKSNSSTSTIPNEASELKNSETTGPGSVVTQPQEALSFDSDLSGLATSDPGGRGPGGDDTGEDVSVKLESISESEMELEITGVEPGRSLPPTPGTSGGGDGWPQGGAGMAYSPGASGSQQDMQAAGYKTTSTKPRALTILTLEEKKRVIKRYEKIKSQRKLADEFGVCRDQIQRLLRRKSEILNATSKKKRKFLTLEEKCRAIKRYEKVQSQRKTAAEFGVGKDQIQRLMLRKTEVLREFNQNVRNDRKRQTGYEDVNEMVWDWLKDVSSTDETVTAARTKAQALKFAKDLGKTTFKASNSWLKNFKKRHNIVFGNIK